MYFTGIIGLDSVKQALLLLAVDARLGGCILSAPVGAGKSLLARAYADLMPERTPFIELPLNVTEDRLLGGLDLEATLSTGQRTLQRGLLSAAHGGALYVDALNLLDSAAEAALIEALTRGEAIVERDGISARHPARFVLIGTYCPAEGELRRGLADRVALIVPFVPGASAEARVAVMSGQLAAAAPQLDEPALHDDALAMLRGLLNDARARLASVVMHDTQVLALARLADSLGVEGNRADVFAAYAAQASAALAQRGTVEDEDLALAARLVLVPRATRLPEREEQTAQAEPPSAPQPQPTDVSDAQQDSLPQTDDRQVEEMLFAALQGDLPADVMTLPFVAARRSRSGSRGIALNASRGRMVRTVEGRRGRIAVLATLLAAAPWQQLRRTERSQQRSRIIVRAADLRVKRFRD
jgi:magnesium chelatase subunit D